MARKRPSTGSPEPASERPDAPWLPLREVLGHAHHRRWLASAIAASRLPHALLICGPKGLGKRTLVEALAIEQFCETRSSCGTCGPCMAWRHGHQTGFLEVTVPDGKSRIALSQIKELSRVLSLRAPSDRGRVIHLRAADRMGGEAQDALLKTLEEPPPGNVLALTTTRSDRVFPTIRSRCQTLWLSPLTDDEMGEAARRLGMDPSVPTALAAGCPGRLPTLADPQVSVLRRGLVRLMGSPRGSADIGRWNALLLHGMEPKPTTEAQRERARLLWTLFGSLLRDAHVLRACGPDVKLCNDDLGNELRSVSSALPSAATVLERLASARARIDGMIDPALALMAVLDDDLSATGPLAGLARDA